MHVPELPDEEEGGEIARRADHGDRLQGDAQPPEASVHEEGLLRLRRATSSCRGGERGVRALVRGGGDARELVGVVRERGGGDELPGCGG